MRALSSNHVQPYMGGRWVLTPKTVDDEADRKMTILRRRRIFVSLLGTVGITLFLGLLPGLRTMLWASLTFALILGAFIAYLIQEKSRTPALRRLTPQIPASDRGRNEDIPTVLRLAYTPPAPIIKNGARPVHRIVDESLEDDGLGELGWLKAGRY